MNHVSVTGAGIVVQGIVDPEGRVVLRAPDNAAYGATADARGQFRVNLPIIPGSQVFQLETQQGQDAAIAPDRLLVIGGEKGAVALLRPGAAARRLDSSSPLEAVDSDGVVAVAAGRANGPVTVTAGGVAREVTPSADSRWMLVLGPLEPGVIIVEDETYDWPGHRNASAQGFTTTRAGLGWSVTWAGAGNAALSTWLPD